MDKNRSDDLVKEVNQGEREIKHLLKIFFFFVQQALGDSHLLFHLNEQEPYFLKQKLGNISDELFTISRCKRKCSLVAMMLAFGERLTTHGDDRTE